MSKSHLQQPERAHVVVQILSRELSEITAELHEVTKAFGRDYQAGCKTSNTAP